MSQSNIPTSLPSVERLVQRVRSAEKSQQKEIRITIQEARDLTSELAIITSRLGQTVTEIHKALNEIKESTGNVDVKFDGGGF
jgi:septation ring formation regulator EzrA